MVEAASSLASFAPGSHGLAPLGQQLAKDPATDASTIETAVGLEFDDRSPTANDSPDCFSQRNKVAVSRYLQRREQ